ncbi:MAG: alanine dehydrogenase [Methanosarcina flavescens]|jgi:alanine dehydrogenase|uniref:Alanine dehydrogenase n=1 Tax=Methanosarcina flavescens TaxID=1715806 RepID=A0A660HP90_9EURY|nr:alanine dehydrogenase [Methanosarcina flavescens]AYK14088.1 alanine dehydrogenase [Methanosarcina flavescens]NLK32686.1 alanine dehydrogenase [Methanosarcina flavescens]
MDVLWLAQEEVKSVMDMSSVMQVVEQAFRQHGFGRVQMPPKSYLYYTAYNGDLRTMPAYLEEENITGVKIVNVHPGNPARGLPTVMALIVLISPETGAPIAVMDGTYLTDVRTGAAGGIAAKYLARKDSKVIGLVGAGNQAKTQLEALCEIFEPGLVRVTSRTKESSEQLIREMAGITPCEIHYEDSIEKVCDCDILVTATPTRKPIVKAQWIKEGTHINAIGADAIGKEELDPELLIRSKIIVDDMVQALHSGEVNVPLSKHYISENDIHAQLGEVIVGLKPGRTSEEEITIFDSTGLAIQDVASAHLVYERAVSNGLGMKVKMF